MKKVFLIGKFNDDFEEMNKYLANHFSVQVCVDNLSVMHSVLKLSNPDFFILNTFDIENKDMFIDELRSKYKDIPLISVETSQENVGANAFEDLSKFRAFVMPVELEKLVQAACNMMGIEYNADTKTIVENVKERKCILAIDDNSFQLRMLNELLKDTYDVEMATSAMKAMTMLGKKIPDLILLDYEMPICDGKMALQMFRELDEVRNVPIIFLTGVKDSAHINAVLALPPAGYILKPAKSEVLLEEIAKHIR